MDYLTLAKLGLQIVMWCMNTYHDAKQFDAGREAEIADQLKLILAKTKAGREMLEKVNAMSASEVDAGLRGLEPR